MDKQVGLPLQPLALSSPYFPPQFQTYLNNFMKNFYTPFIYKDYHIKIGGPNGDHPTANMIYEDAIPPTEVFLSYKSLKERNNLVDYIRSNFIRVTEGEYVNFQGNVNSLNSRLNLTQLNPFDTNIHGGGPYYSLGKGYRIYKSCYPITYNKAEGSSMCQKNSIGLLLRDYELTLDALVAKFPEVNRKATKTDINGTKVDIVVEGSNSKPDDFDVWRDIKYYQYIREQICKAMISPNFLQSYCYFLNNDANFDYKKIGKSLVPDHDPNNSKNAAILLTESPNFNLITWASNIYTINRNIRVQTYSGYKSKENWQVIVFQMLSAFYIMNKFNFTFNEMSIYHNFFIKDVNVYGDGGSQFWVYNINKVDYYVPCRGDLLLIDHDYHDLKTSGQHRILAEIFGNSKTEIQDLIRKHAISCIDFNNFSQFASENYGLVKPPEDVIKLFEKVNTDLRATNPDGTYTYTIEEVIKNNFIRFVHNRVGTMVRDNEKDYIRKSDVRPFIKGELVIYETKYETYEIVMYIENVNEYTCRCASRDKGEIVIRDYQKDLMYHYSENEVIRQDVLPGQPAISLDYIIEKYVL